MKKENEKVLLKSAKAGSEEDTELLISTYKPLVASIVRQYFLLGGDTDDLLQEGMLALFQAILTYDETNGATFKTFASLCIKRRVQTAIKQANRQKNKMLNYFIPINNQGIVLNESQEENEDDDEKETGIYITSKIPNPENVIISKEAIKYIHEQIENKLSILEKKVLQLFVSGESYQNIALKLNISKKTVDNVLFKVRRKLAYLKEE